MTSERNRELMLWAGRDLITRAEKLLAEGKIQGYIPCVRESDPAIVLWIDLIKKAA